MSRIIGAALFFVGVTFAVILFLSMILFSVNKQKMDDFHYQAIHELECSDFAETVIQSYKNNSNYDVEIYPRSLKDDMAIFEVVTSTTLKIPILRYETKYTKTSFAR